MAALVWVLFVILLSPVVVTIFALRIAQPLEARLLNFCGRREQDAPETFPSQPPQRRGMPMCHGTPPFLVSALLFRSMGQRRGTQPIQVRTASVGGSHPKGRNGARNERSGAPAQRVDCRPRERYAHNEVAAPGRLRTLRALFAARR